jgi:uncharacterized membrane protein YccF (DUF307 family)
MTDFEKDEYQRENESGVLIVAWCVIFGATFAMIGIVVAIAKALSAIAG